MIGFAGTMAPDGHDLVGLCRLMAAENVQNVGTEWDVHNVQKVQKLNWNCRLYWDGFWMLKRIPEWLLIGWFMNAGMFFGWILNAQNDKTNLLQNDAWTLGQWTPRVIMLGQWIICRSSIIPECLHENWQRKRNIYTSLIHFVHRDIESSMQKEKSNLRH